MENNIFRKKSLDRIKSPESLNDYVRVASPSVWALLVAIIVLLMGTIVWGIFGKMDTTLDVVAISEQGRLECFVSGKDINDITPGMKVTIMDKECSIINVGDYDAEKGLYRVETDGNVPDGKYGATIIVNSEKPISFVIN